jgi:SAM-dependent methyltransferase
MSLYEHLAAVYDELFPVNPATLNFVEGLFEKGRARRRAVDLGSATGGHAIAFAERGWEITAVEPSPLLGESSRSKAAAARLEVRHVQGDMRAIADYILPGSLDLLLCLGNTLPHLENSGEIESFLGKARRVLAGDGVLVLQLVNFRITGPGFTFPPIRQGGIEFDRSYSLDAEERLRFDTRLVLANGVAWEDSTELCPIPPAGLGEALAAAGFSRVERYAGWDREAFDEERSRFLIAVARP